MSTTVEVESIESLETQVRKLDAALQASRKVRLLFLCAVLVLMALIIYSFLGLFHKVTSEPFKMAVAEQAQARFEQNQVRYMNDVKSLVDDASPVVTEAFYAQSKVDMAKYASAVDKEREVFLKDVQSKLDAQLKKKYADLLSKYEAQLVKEFPELQDEAFRAKVMHSLDKAVGELASKYYTQQLGVVIGNIFAAWDRFPPVDEPKKDQPPLGEQLIGSLLELMSSRLSQ